MDNICFLKIFSCRSIINIKKIIIYYSWLRFFSLLDINRVKGVDY